MDSLYLIGFFQSLFFLSLILTKRKLILKDYLLGGYILVLGINLLFIFLNQTGLHDKYPLLIILDFAYWTLLGPLLYLYVEIITSPSPKLRFKYLIHLLPLTFVLVAFGSYILNSNSIVFFKYQNDSLLFKVGYFVWMYNSPFYYILLIIKLRIHRLKVQEFYSSTKNVDLKWLRYLVHGFAIFLFFLLFSPYLAKFIGNYSFVNSYHYGWFILVLYIFGIGYFGYKQKGIFSEIDIESNKTNEIIPNQSVSYESLNSGSNERNQYSKSGLTDFEAVDIQQRLEKYMIDEKPYLDYDITLPKLAYSIETTPNKLSQVINEKYNLNFFDFINKYRITEFINLLNDPLNNDAKIMGLAYDCGFNSKSAFYNFFKKETSFTPTEYRNKKLSEINN
ncbi:MAG: hypothetical protein A2W99_04140 [Bacteroidetes bacterium GWF2_33_16]|nr:MAG: hypothetical protein A2X00_07355 [Bacteroidetes bacterium GWE2_32_14]OFY02980.1 MAG: hypothetical protein A2W99_04140 [Bacteroidetes bacterium GWF2_33_16]